MRRACNARTRPALPEGLMNDNKGVPSAHGSIRALAFAPWQVLAAPRSDAALSAPG